MFVVLTVDVPVDDVIDVSVVRNRDVLASDPVKVIRRVCVAAVRLAARGDVAGRELVLENGIARGMVQMTVVHVVDVIVVSDGQMTTILSVDVLVTIMGGRYHVYLSSSMFPDARGPNVFNDPCRGRHIARTYHRT